LRQQQGAREIEAQGETLSQDSSLTDQLEGATFHEADKVIPQANRLEMSQSRQQRFLAEMKRRPFIHSF
jgi:uncharacterized protein (DUF1778 family)